MSVAILKCLNVINFRHPSFSVLIPALRTVGNIVTGDDMQTQVSIKNMKYSQSNFPSIMQHSHTS